MLGFADIVNTRGAATLSLALFATSWLTGCSWKEALQRDEPTLQNAAAIDRALKLCALTQGEQPFHLILEVIPPTPAKSASPSDIREQQEMRAHIELYWLSPITYRTVIHSRKFSQTRIVNGNVIEEHNTGDFYPRWIQNFVDALLEPVPRASDLRKVPGSVPISPKSHACIATPAGLSDETAAAQVCFQDVDPKLASGQDFSRYVAFDDFAPFGPQSIARTLVNDLPENLLLRGQITRLEPLPRSAYPLLKAREFTPASKQIRTSLISRDQAQAILESSHAQEGPPIHTGPTQGQMTLYIRTDRKGHVREAYRGATDQYSLQDAVLERVLTYKFKPLIVHGAPQQIEAPLVLSPSTATSTQSSH